MSYPALSIDVAAPSAIALQNTIQQGLAARGYASHDDPVMAEYVLVMLANSKTKQQIDAELMDLIGGQDYNEEFTSWLWEVAQNSSEGQPKPQDSNMMDTILPSGDGSGMISAQGDTQSHTTTNQEDVRSPRAQRNLRRSRSPPLRPEGSKRSGDHWVPERRQEGQNRDRRSQGYTDRRAPRPPRELFGPPNTSGSSQDPGNNGQSLAMDDPALLRQQDRPSQRPQQVRIRGRAPEGPARELFAESLNHASQQPGERSVWQRGSAETTGESSTGPSLFARAGVPDPRASAFVPQTFQSSNTFAPAAHGNNGLFTRIDPMLPNNAMPMTTMDSTQAQTTRDSASFPTKPSQTSLCRYALECTNPLCSYSHPSPAAALAKRKGNATIDPVVTTEKSCKFGSECTNIECGFSHVSPGVTFAKMKQSITPQSSAGPAFATLPTQSTPCHFADKCTNPSCAYAHFDAAGQPAPSPALAKLISRPKQADTAAGPADAEMNGGGQQEADHEGDVEIEMNGHGEQTQDRPDVGADGKPLALDRPLGSASGPTQAGNGARPCKFGTGCMRADCWFSHPEWRKTTTSATPDDAAHVGTLDPSTETQGAPHQLNGSSHTAASKGLGGGKAHISDRLSRFSRDGGETEEAEVIIPERA